MNAAESAYVAPISVLVGKIGRQERLILQAPYHPQFAPKAKLLGGKWYPDLKTGDRTIRAWSFDPRDSDRVAALCSELYGYDWDSYRTTPLGTVRITIPRAKLGWATSVYAFGREVFDWQVGTRKIADKLRLGAGVLLIDGSFSDTSSTLVFEMKDVPLSFYGAERDAVARRGFEVEMVAESLPRTLPVPRQFTFDADQVNPTIPKILALWDTLSAREQGILLEELLHSTPSVAGR